MNPRALRHEVRAGAVNNNHLAHGEFVLEGVVVDFGVVAADHQVMAAAGKLKCATRIAAVAGARRDFFTADLVRELESLDDDISSGRFQKWKPSVPLISCAAGKWFSAEMVMGRAGRCTFVARCEWRSSRCKRRSRGRFLCRGELCREIAASNAGSDVIFNRFC